MQQVTELPARPSTSGIATTTTATATSTSRTGTSITSSRCTPARARRRAAARRAPTRSGAIAGTRFSPRSAQRADRQDLVPFGASTRAVAVFPRRTDSATTSYWVGDYTIEPENGGVASSPTSSATTSTCRICTTLGNSVARELDRLLDAHVSPAPYRQRRHGRHRIEADRTWARGRNSSSAG